MTELDLDLLRDESEYRLHNDPVHAKSAETMIKLLDELKSREARIVKLETALREKGIVIPID